MALNRRHFLASSVAAGATLATTRWARAAGEASDIRVAVIGTHGQGRGHIGKLTKNLVALCDVDSQVLAERAAEFADKNGRKLETFSDYRKLLERKDIDAVSIATPNHTHSLIAIAALEAGKDVYCEKPISHNVWEGRQLVAAARKYNRIAQCGTQSRSAKCLQDAVAYVRSGELGKIQYVVGTCFKARPPIGKLDKPLVIPKSVDYNLWCGPAAQEELYRPKLHYDWHWNYNTGAGDMGNQGIHQMDIARWFLGESSVAPRTLSIGGRLGYEDAANSANTQVVLHDYAAAPLIFETRGLPRSKGAQAKWADSMDRFRGSGVGVLVQCERGLVFSPTNYVDVYAYDRQGNEIKHWHDPDGANRHHANWLGAIAARDSKQLNAEIHEGHLSSSLCHLGNISHRLGAPATAGEIADKLRGNDLLSDSFERMAGHLRANGVELDAAPGALTLGMALDIDPATEQVQNNSPAMELWKRSGRGEFTIPDLERTA